MSWDLNRPRTLETLFRQLDPELRRIVAANVRAPAYVIEEACQVAWATLVARGATVSAGTELRWLGTTATREALRLMRLARRELSLEQGERATGLLEAARIAEPERATELRERLAEVRALPLRQRRMVLMQSFGYRYEEIAELTGDSVRTVERQLLRARRRLAG